MLAEAVAQLLRTGVSGEKAELPIAATFEDGHYVQKVIDACRRSNDLGTWIDV